MAEDKKKAQQKPGGFGKVNPKVQSWVDKNTPLGALNKILRKAQPRKSGSK